VRYSRPLRAGALATLTRKKADVKINENELNGAKVCVIRVEKVNSKVILTTDCVMCAISSEFTLNFFPVR